MTLGYCQSEDTLLEIEWNGMRISGSVTKSLEENSPNLWKKVSKIVVWSKNAKISTPKLNLKAKNIYVQTLLNLENLKNTFFLV